jgi:predicted phosphodiesterase
VRIAIVSDIHGNLTALEAVLKDLRFTSPDLILHGGDLADSGSRPAEVMDLIRNLGWDGVYGNTDEVHFHPELLEEFASRSSAPKSLWAAVREMAAATEAMVGSERIAWLGTLPRVLTTESTALVHASPQSTWKAPGPESSDQELMETYAPLGKPAAVYGHIHRPFVRDSRELLVANSGSVSLSYDGDPRAAYLLVDDLRSTIRRVEYDIDKEIQALSTCGLPYTDWVVRMLKSASPQLPGAA